MSEKSKPSGAMHAILVEGAAQVDIKNGTFVGFDTAIVGRGVGTFNASGNRFIDVTNPFDVEALQANVEGTRISAQAPSAHNPAQLSRASMIGYEAKRAPALPAQCQTCGSIFPSRYYNVRSPRFYGFDNLETCQRSECDGRASLAEGIFDLSDDLVKIIHGEALTFAQVAAIGALAREIVSSPQDQEKTILKIAKISPGIAAKIRSFLNNPSVIGWTGIFVGLVSIYLPLVIPNQKPDCVISKSELRHGERVDLHVTAALEACFAAMNLVMLQDPQKQSSPPREIETGREAPKERPSAKVETEIDGDVGKKAVHLNLPNTGPIPRARPKME